MASELCKNTESNLILYQQNRKYKTWIKIVTNVIQESDVQKHHFVMTLLFQDVMNEQRRQRCYTAHIKYLLIFSTIYFKQSLFLQLQRNTQTIVIFSYVIHKLERSWNQSLRRHLHPDDETDEFINMINIIKYRHASFMKDKQCNAKLKGHLNKYLVSFKLIIMILYS